MARLLMTDSQWNLVEDIFFRRAKTGRPPADRRRVLDGIFWILRTGSPWRDLPKEFGPFQTVWRLFDQWNADGTLDAVKDRLRTASPDSELWCVDGTTVRAHRCAAGGGKKTIPMSR